MKVAQLLSEQEWKDYLKPRKHRDFWGGERENCHANCHSRSLAPEFDSDLEKQAEEDRKAKEKAEFEAQ